MRHASRCGKRVDSPLASGIARIEELQLKAAIPAPLSHQ